MNTSGNRCDAGTACSADAPLQPLQRRSFYPLTLVLLFVILVFTWVLRMNFWDQPFEMDEGLHAYMGWGMLEGLVPFRDMYNTKPPGIYVLHSLLFLVVEPTALNIKVFATIYTLGTVFAVFFVARKLAGEKVGLFAALLFGIFSSGPNIQGGGVNTEIFMVLPYTLAALSLIDAVKTGRQQSYFLTGLWTGLACTIKQVAVVNLFWVASYLIVRIWRERSWQALARTLTDGAWVVLGVVVPWLPFLLYFYFHDALSNFFFWMVSANFLYIEDGYKQFPYIILLSRTGDVLKENSLLWLLSMAAIGWWWQNWRKARPVSSGGEDRRWQLEAWALLAIWPVFSFLGVALGGRFFPHYYIQMIPTLSILAGMGLMVLSREIGAIGLSFFKRPVGVVVAGVFTWSLIFFIVTESPYYLKYDGVQVSYHQYETPVFSVTRYIGSYLRNQTQPEDHVYVWAVNPEINFYALRKSPSPILMHVDFDHFPWDPFEEVVQSLRSRPPKYIVAMTGMSAFPGLRDYVQSNYRAETNTELNKLKQLVPFEIYRRKGV